MELDEFIRETISQIMLGVSQAAVELQNSKIGGFVAPQNQTLQLSFDRLDIRSVDFDVAVTVESKAEANRGAKASIKVIEGLIASSTSERRLGESRVRFSVPVCFPGTGVYLTAAESQEGSAAIQKRLAEG